MGALYQIDSPKSRFVKKQYKDALKELELEGRITCDKPHTQRRKGTLSDDTTLIF